MPWEKVFMLSGVKISFAEEATIGFHWLSLRRWTNRSSPGEVRVEGYCWYQRQCIEKTQGHKRAWLGQRGFPGGSVGKESACSAGDSGLIPGLGRSSGERNGNPLQYSCLGNPMDRGSWRVTVHGVSGVGHNLVTKPLTKGNGNHGVNWVQGYG